MAEKQNITEEIKIDENLEILKKYFPSCFDKDGKFNLEKFKEEINVKKLNLSKESYGLEWLGKSYARVLTFEPARTLLRENENWNKKPENKNSGNLLIKGDNIEVLKHLVNAYYEKIKMIYIDPPYNTGNDGFVYQDDRKFTVKELMELAGVNEERAKRILDFVNSKSNSHSAWLTFMYPRLYIARRLLRENGVIFVSIDDNEVAQLRILMDEIFGEENFVAQLIWEKVRIRKNSALYFTENHDYILVYAKLKKQDVNDRGWERNLLKREIHNYKNPDNDPNGPWIKGSLIANHHYSADYKIVKPNGVILEKPKNGSWRYSYESIQKFINENRIIWGKGNSYPMVKKYLKDAKDGLVPKTILSFEEFGGNPDGANELKRLFNDLKIFENPKPTELLKKIIYISNVTSDDLILDFFAGSGTIGDAVMQLNAEDGGNRKYILVQLPEPIDQKKSKAAYDFVKNELGVQKPTIFEITKERLKRAAKKIKDEIISKKIEGKQKEIEKLQNKLDFEEKDKKIKQLKEGIKNLKDQDLGVKIFETIPIWENYLADDKKLTDETVLLEVNKLKEEDLKALLITWKTYDGLLLTEDYKKVKLNDYTAYYCGTNLYLMYGNWQTKNIKTLLEKIDTDKDFVVEKIIVFGYNFTSKHLREIEENVRNYANKKQIEIETILRF